MTALLPASLADPGPASPWPARFLVLYGLFWIVPGLIHAFLPDGGIGSIGGIDMSQGFAALRAMAAWAGATQIVHGLACVIVGLRYRALVPLFLALGLVERAIMTWSAWYAHLSPSGHHPPAHYGDLVALPLLALFLWLALRGQSARVSASYRSRW